MDTGQVAEFTEDWPPGDLSLDFESSPLGLGEGGRLITLDAPNPESVRLNSSVSTADASPCQFSWESSTPQAISSSSRETFSLSNFTTTVTHLRPGSPSSKHAAVLISDILSAFPHRMLRRQTFPPFIHAHWHSPTLPEELASCVSISQLFSTRTSETRSFLWRTVEAEEQRFRDKVSTSTSPHYFPASLLIRIAQNSIRTRDSTCYSSHRDLHHHGYRRPRNRQLKAGRKADVDIYRIVTLR